MRNRPDVVIPPAEPSFDANERDIYAKLKAFVLGDSTELAFPTESSAYRKRVHQLAMEFELEHESVGKGKERHVVVRKIDATDAARRRDTAHNLLLAIQQYENDCKFTVLVNSDDEGDASDATAATTSMSAVRVRGTACEQAAASAAASLPPTTPAAQGAVRLVEWNIEWFEYW